MLKASTKAEATEGLAAMLAVQLTKPVIGANLERSSRARQPQELAGSPLDGERAPYLTRRFAKLQMGDVQNCARSEQRAPPALDVQHNAGERRRVTPGRQREPAAC